MKFRKKPVAIDAVQWTGQNMAEVANFAGGRVLGSIMPEAPFAVVTLEGAMTARVGDWLICGVKGEIYPCKPDIFAATYEAAEVADELSAALTLAESKSWFTEEKCFAALDVLEMAVPSSAEDVLEVQEEINRILAAAVRAAQPRSTEGAEKGGGK